MRPKIRFVLLLLSACNIIHVAFAQKAKKYFEGTVKYSIEYSPYAMNVSTDSLSEVFGATMEFTIKNGHTRKCYYKKDGTTISTEIFNPTNNLVSTFIDGIDTLYQFHADHTPFYAIEYNHLRDTIIDGANLEGIRVVMVDDKNIESKPLNFWSTPMTFSYYFDKRLEVNPSNFSKFHECEWSRIIKEKKSVSTYIIVDNGRSFITKKKSTTITTATISSNLFKIPDRLHIKNIN